MYFSIKCLLLGHDDSMVRAQERLWLRCDHCGRETAGWKLDRSRSLHQVRSTATPFAGARPVTALHGMEQRVAA